MSEQPIFWLGGKPGKSNPNVRPVPEAERYEATLREACEGCGYEVDEYIAAQGGFGGWLAHLQKGSDKYRICWSGKSKQLTLDQLHEPGGWAQLQLVDTPDEGIAGFVSAVRGVLGEG